MVEVILFVCKGSQSTGFHTGGGGGQGRFIPHEWPKRCKIMTRKFNKIIRFTAIVISGGIAARGNLLRDTFAISKY
jgi:hypothetical protein